MRNVTTISVCPDRKNIRNSVHLVKKNQDLERLDWIADLAREMKTAMPKTIVFCNTFNEIASVFAYLQCIFNPGTKILIAGPTFRTARFIFNNLEHIVNSKGAELLRQAFNARPSKRNI